MNGSAQYDTLANSVLNGLARKLKIVTRYVVKIRIRMQPTRVLLKDSSSLILDFLLFQFTVILTSPSIEGPLVNELKTVNYARM